MEEKLNSLDQFKMLNGGIENKRLEKLIENLIDLLTKNSTEWSEGIDLINDLIYLRKHDFSKLSLSACEQIYQWIKTNYDSERFSNGYNLSEESVDESLIKLLDQTIDTLYAISHCLDIKPFINSKLDKATANFESYELNELLSTLEQVGKRITQRISTNTLDKVLNLTNNYFRSSFENNKETYLLCGLKETIKEHDYCYTIDWCLKSEKYFSRVKKSMFGGGGFLMVSKISNDIEMAGSSPSVDWLKQFEIKIRGLEAYWSLSINYDKSKISHVKTLLNLSTSELVKLVNQDSKIEWEDEEFELRVLEKDFKKVDIKCELLFKERLKVK